MACGSSGPGPGSAAPHQVSVRAGRRRTSRVHAGGRRAVATDIRPGRRPPQTPAWPLTQPGEVCRTPAVRRPVVRAVVPEAADGQSADGFDSQFLLLFLKAGLRRPSSRRQATSGTLAHREPGLPCIVLGGSDGATAVGSGRRGRAKPVRGRSHVGFRSVNAQSDVRNLGVTYAIYRTCAV